MPAETQSPETTRRNFYIGAINGLMAIISAALAVPAIAYLFFPAKQRRRDEWIAAGDLTKLVPDSPVELVFQRNQADAWKVQSMKETAWVVKSAGDRVVAFGPNCTHLGCAYHWESDQKEFFCPCHNSAFAIDGSVISGPAPRPLDRYDTKIDGSKLLIGRLRQASETKAAANRPGNKA